MFSGAAITQGAILWNVSDHIQTLFGPSEDGYELPPDPEPGDDAWRKLTWVMYPLMVVAIFSHGALSKTSDKAVWTLFVLGSLITSEWSQLRKLRTRLYIGAAAIVHFCIMTFTYSLLAEHRRLMAIILIAAVESFLLVLPIRLLAIRDER